MRAIQGYELLALRERHTVSPEALFHVSNTGRYPWHSVPGAMTKATTGGSQVSGVTEPSNQTEPRCRGGNVAGGRRALVMVELKTGMYTAWIRGHVSGSKTPTHIKWLNVVFAPTCVRWLRKGGFFREHPKAVLGSVWQQLRKLQSPDALFV